MKTIQINLSGEVETLLTRLAAATGKSESAVIEAALRRHCPALAKIPNRRVRVPGHGVLLDHAMSRKLRSIAAILGRKPGELVTACLNSAVAKHLAG